jgi:hypothetical protein
MAHIFQACRPMARQSEEPKTFHLEHAGRQRVVHRGAYSAGLVQ